MAKPIDHCVVCELSQKDKQFGRSCQLTNDKPKFIQHCDKINFGKNAFRQIEEVIFKEKMMKNKKFLTILNCIIFFTLGMAFISMGYLLGDYIISLGVFASAPLVIMFIGFLFFPLSVGPVRSYLTENKIVDDRKKRIMNVLNLYQMDYDAVVEIEKQNHDFLGVNVQIKLLKNNKVYQEYSNQFEYNNSEKMIRRDVLGGFVDQI
ncbi:hypothetical protein [Aureibacter tunicatorum]|uniref:Uncharacterized protein n=1 Tax=Aureibacter tunicatorum TaxID=866807 RepID=A0AAE3XP84_9BACT|nr:hypothetical protein [Aureibacter tunicatorum]MDR6240587.1 hypothetical protein [Aureibacter tunicatorum]BDD06552.1 hypothetical protein AUTU_40350 [Aureibacter tunicatorum]